MVSILLGGGYLAIILYALLLNNDDFREYVTTFAETIIKIFHIKKTHPYTIMQMFGVVLLLCSWIGLVLLGLLVYDYFLIIKIYKNKQKK